MDSHSAGRRHRPPPAPRDGGVLPPADGQQRHVPGRRAADRRPAAADGRRRRRRRGGLDGRVSGARGAVPPSQGRPDPYCSTTYVYVPACRVCIAVIHDKRRPHRRTGTADMGRRYLNFSGRPQTLPFLCDSRRVGRK